MQRRRITARVTYAAVAVALAATILLRLPFLHNGMYPDEGGMLVVAREWHTGGPYLYGDYFLARPPLLLLFFRLGDALGGIVAVRLLGLVLVTIAVAAAAWAGSSLAGRRGAITAAVVSAALLTDPILGTVEIDAETVGLPLTLAATACLLAAYRRSRGSSARAWLLVAGGALAVGALLTKQNLADALAFGLVLVIGSALTEGRPREALPDLGCLGLGIAVPVLATLAWAAFASAGIHELVYELYGFRAQSGQTLMAQPTIEQGERLHILIDAVIRSGIVPVVLVSLWMLRLRFWRDPVVLALLAMMVTAVVGVAAGGQYWIHYLIGLVPVTALVAARAVGRVSRPFLLAAMVVVTVATTAHNVSDAWHARHPTDESWVGGTTVWLDATKRPGDSMVVLYGQAALYETTRIQPAYPYMWTLPMRIRDPQLAHLRRLLSGPDAPTFVLVALDLDSWSIDPHGRMQRTIDRHYRKAATVCGTPVYLRNGVDRPSVPPPTSCDSELAVAPLPVAEPSRPFRGTGGK